MSRHHRENKRGWETIRQRELRRAGRRCEVCRRPGKLEVHHPRPLSKGGDHDQKLKVVCRSCHFQEHHKPDPARVAWGRFLQEELARAEITNAGVEAV